MDDTELDARLAALEARVPATEPPPLPARRTRRSRLGAPIALAPAMLLLLVATAAAAGGVVGAGIARVGEAEGVENPGQPLAGANLECMSPPEAQAYLTAHGYTDVVWQVETGKAGEKGGSSTQQATAPQHGFVVPASILGDGKLYIVVDQRAGATGVGACFDEPMP